MQKVELVAMDLDSTLLNNGQDLQKIIRTLCKYKELIQNE